ncbi:hypothetical protein RYX36_022272 [Vicia faba]
MKHGLHSISELISWHHHGTICGSDSKSNVVGDVMNLNCEISEDISSQLYMGVMKAARRVVLDGIIGDIISEFVTEKKCKNQKLESSDRTSETCTLDSKKMNNGASISPSEACTFPFLDNSLIL